MIIANDDAAKSKPDWQRIESIIGLAIVLGLQWELLRRRRRRLETWRLVFRCSLSVGASSSALKAVSFYLIYAKVREKRNRRECACETGESRKKKANEMKFKFKNSKSVIPDVERIHFFVVCFFSLIKRSINFVFD